jgi:hypothetical protein
MSIGHPWLARRIAARITSAILPVPDAFEAPAGSISQLDQCIAKQRILQEIEYDDGHSTSA